MNNGIFEGSNVDATYGYTAIYTIPGIPVGGWNEVVVSLGTYRYLRYRSPSVGSYCNVSEVEFYRNEIKVEGTFFGTPGTYGGGNTFEKAFDGNTTTYFDAPETYNQNAFVGVDSPVYVPPPTGAAVFVPLASFIIK